MKLNSLKPKLLAAFLATSLAAAVVGWTGLSAVRTVESLVARNVEVNAPQTLQLARLRFAFTRLCWAINKAIAADSLKDAVQRDISLELREQSNELMRQAAAEYEKLPMGDGARAGWQEYQRSLGEWRATERLIWKGIEAGNTELAWKQLQTISATTARVQDSLAKLFELQAEEVKQLGKQAEEVHDTTVRTVTLVTLLSMLAAAGLGTLLTLAITRPLEQIRRASRLIALGNVDQTVEHKGGDEIGALADSFRELIDYIKGIASAADRIGRGDLSVRLQKRSDADVLTESVGRVSERLNSLKEQMHTMIEAARTGRLDARADASHFEGGYAELLTGLNQVVQAVALPIGEANQVLSRLAARDLTTRARDDFGGEYGKMMTSLNSAVDKLQQSLRQVAGSAEQVATSSSEIAASSQSVAQGASEQASALEETSSALTQMAASTRRNAESAQHANGLAEEAKRASGMGAKEMERMTDAMGKIRASAEGTAAIIRDINDIAFQTNLLALNAAVEAARAGEAGRGFAVVAEEVRNLALRSKEAAKKTEALISESMTLAKQGEDISGRVSTTLEGIIGSVAKVTAIVNEIAHASVEQAQGIDQSNKAMAQMDQATQLAAANSEESSSAAEELAGQAHELASLVGEFQIGNASRGSQKEGRPGRQPLKMPPSLPRGARKKPNGAAAPVSGGSHGGNGWSANSIIPLENDPEFQQF